MSKKDESSGSPAAPATRGRMHDLLLRAAASRVGDAIHNALEHSPPYVLLVADVASPLLAGIAEEGLETFARDGIAVVAVPRAAAISLAAGASTMPGVVVDEDVLKRLQQDPPDSAAWALVIAEMQLTMLPQRLADYAMIPVIRAHGGEVFANVAAVLELLYSVDPETFYPWRRSALYVIQGRVAEALLEECSGPSGRTRERIIWDALDGERFAREIAQHGFPQALDWFLARYGN